MSTHEETVEIGVGTGQIAGTFVTPGTLLPGVLFVHGWGGCQQQYLARAR
ncbi:MAG TPA: alpha/beta hydrolase, partial [Roseateles sp.]|nr:alpha/beta hydrolase [Roseateles sp.]